MRNLRVPGGWGNYGGSCRRLQGQVPGPRKKSPRPRTLQNLHRRAVDVSLDRTERVFDIDALAEFANPDAALKLPGRMSRHANLIREEGDFLQARFQVFVVAQIITQRCERS